MKIPKFLKKSLSPEEHQRIALENAKRYSSAEAMARGDDFLPISVTDSFTDAERSCLPKNMIPWVRVESPYRVYLFTYSHFEREGEDFMKTVRKRSSAPNLMLCIFNGDGTPWPSSGGQLMIEVNCSPDDIVGTKLGMSIVNRMLIHFSYPGSQFAQTVGEDCS